MTNKEYNDLQKGDIVNYKDDDPNTHPMFYNWEIMHINKDGMMIENDKSAPRFLDKDEALEKLIIPQKKKIEAWRLGLDPTNSEAWTGEITVVLNAHDLTLLKKSISSANYNGMIDDDERKYLMDKLNIVE